MADIGVFICRCDARPGLESDPERLLAESRRDPRVRVARVLEDLCCRPFADALGAEAGGTRLDAAVVALCEPAVHEDSFRSALAVLGVPAHRVRIVDLASPGDPVHALRATLAGIREDDTAPEEPLTDVVPKALVVGGGVAGIQASLDIAEGGFEVFLVEKDPSIGGHMLQLSEVFPTLDCPQCIMTPKMVQAAQHPNIRLWSYSELESLEGRPGRFKARIRHKSAFVDWETCTGCSECAKACPVEVYSDWDRGIAPSKATSRPFAQAVPNKFTIKKLGVSPCRAACPAGLNAHAYVSLIRAGKFERALEIVREGVLFAGILGRVCPHPCEKACLRGTVDEPIRICSLKRFLADRDPAPVPVPACAPDTGKKVAIVGAGPAGLAAAHDLRMKGVAVTLFDAADRVGGMMAFGIPEYTLPRDVLKREGEDWLRAMGAQFRLNTRVGADVSFAELRRGHDAVLLAAGAWEPVPLGIPGEDLSGVTAASAFMVAHHRGASPEVGRRTVVLGGGTMAFDAARTARRLGAEDVILVYRRTADELPVAAEERAAAEEEGVRVRFLTAPVALEGSDGRVTGVRVRSVALGPADRAGRRRPRAARGEEEVLPADTVLVASRHRPDRSGLETDEPLPVTAFGTLDVDPKTLATPLAGVFAAGDAVTGPDTVVGAVASGRRAAESMARFLEGRDLFADRDGPRREVVTEADTRQALPGARAEVARAPVADRLAGFGEAERGMAEEAAVSEANRCLSCAACCECLECVAACEAKAVNHALEDRIEEVEVGAVVLATGYDLYPPAAVREYDPDPDVLDGLQFERILCPSGPTDGRVLRPSDGREPKEVVFVACVGSRDPEHHKAYCSRVCCMYSVKMAMLYKHAVHDGQAHFFYMDVRTDGKLYEEFYQRAAEEDGVDFIRGRVSRIHREGDVLVVRGVDTLADTAVEIRADLVVLAMAMLPRREGRETANRLGVELDANGFMRERHAKLLPLDSSREGIFLAGTAQGPKDIPECVAHASGTAGRVLALLNRGRRRAAPQAPLEEPLSAGTKKR